MANAGTTEVPVPPSSEGSARQSHASQNHVEATRPGNGSEFDEDEFDSDEFRAWMRNRSRGRHGRRRQNDSDEDGQDDHRSSSGPPPEWDGEAIPFVDYQIKANLWLATTKAKPRTRGPLLLQKLSKTPFEAMKYLARDSSWMTSDRNGEELLRVMNLPENFGDDQEEDLLSSLAKVTYHLRRGRDEGHRAFFSKWDQAMRKVTEHRVVLPDQYVGFLLINALSLSDSDIKSFLNFSRGSIRPSDVREWVRKHETKLQVSQVGIDKKATTRTSSTHYVTAENYDQDEDEIHAVEEALRDLQEDEAENGTEIGDDDALEEHEAAEILNTYLQQKRKTYTQTLKAKKAKELGRGYVNKWKTGRSVTSTGTGVPPFREGQFKMTIEELKKVTRCGICHRTGHWHRECPEKDKQKNNSAGGAKETHVLETEEAIFCGHLQLSGQGDMRAGVSDNLLEPSTGSTFSNAQHQDGAAGQAGDSSDRRQYLAEQHDHEVLFGEGKYPIDSSRTKTVTIPEEACATLDTGCQRMAVGKCTLEALLKHIPEDIPVKIHDQEHRFKSVHGKSCTKHVASIPTSIGKKGSFLKPAVFENEESVNAPFLISLPFLMACRTTLVLDPETGLRAHLKKLGVTVPCHIGPTGALRVPLCSFSKNQLEMLKQDFHHEAKGKEFEILRTDHSGSVEWQPTAPDCGDRDRDDGAQQQASSRGDTVPDDVDVAMHGQKDALCDPAVRDRLPLHGTTWTSTSSRRSTEIAGDKTIDITIKGINNERDEHDLGGGERRDGDASYHHTRDHGNDGDTTEVLPQHGEQALCVLHREEQPTSVLAMSVSKDPTMSVLQVDQGSTTPGVPRVPEQSKDQPTKLKHYIHEEPLSTPQHFPTGHQRPQDCREVHGLQGDPGRAEDREGHLEGTGEAAEEAGQVDLPYRAQVTGNPIDTRTGPTNPGVRGFGDRGYLDGPHGRQLRDTVAAPEEDLLNFGNKRSRRVLRQARAALTSAHEQWVDIMTCFKMPSPASGEYLENFLCTIEPEDRAKWGPRKIRRLASLLGVQKSQAKAVAEVYNPNRFGPRTKKFGLQQGQAFDLELGHDIRQEGTRRTIRKYIRTQKPGLVCVSPPCTLMSLMQNMNQHDRDADPQKQREFDRRMVEARLLLSFSIEICEMVREYGGTFCFEHPWTSKAWHDHHLKKLMERDDVYVARCDQCMFDLNLPREISIKSQLDG